MKKKVLIFSLIGLLLLLFQNCGNENSFSSIESVSSSAVHEPEAEEAPAETTIVVDPVEPPVIMEPIKEPVNNNCSLFGKTIKEGDAIEAFAQASVPYDESCVSEDRVCSNGVLSGTFKKMSCTLEPKPKSLCKPSDCDKMITDLSGLEAIKSGTSFSKIRYCLSGNLDLGLVVDPAAPAQLGNIELNGCGYSIKNFMVKSKPLFPNMTSSEVKQINFDNVIIDVKPGSGYKNFGAIVGTGNDVYFKDIKLRNLNRPSIKSGGFKDIMRCGLLVGYFKGEASGVSISGDKLNISGCYYMGAAIGVWGTGNAQDSHVIDSVEIDIDIDANHFDFFGPLIGYLWDVNNNRPPINISDIEVRSKIVAGGKDCQVPDVGLGRCQATGGVIGRIDYISDPFIFLDNLLFQGSILVPDTGSFAQAGGLVGFIYYSPNSNFGANFADAKVKISQSQLNGTLKISTTTKHSDTYGGVLVGATMHKKHLVFSANNSSQFQVFVQGVKSNKMTGADHFPHQY